MSNLFHKDVTVEFIKQVFKVINENPQHVFQELTKRVERLFEIHKELRWTHNIWTSVSVEASRIVERINFLRRTKAKVKFLSLEPLIGELKDLNLKKMDWIIAGGKGGHNPATTNPDWVLYIQSQCRKAKVSFFFKQWGEKNKKATGRTLNGRTYDEIPEVYDLVRKA